MPEVETLQDNLCLCHCLNVLAVEFSQVWTFLSLVQDNYLFSHHTSKRIASSKAASVFYFKAKEWLLLNVTSFVPQTYNLNPAGTVGHMALPLMRLLLVFLTRLSTWTQYPPLIAFPASTLFLLSHIDQSQSAISSSPICLTSPTPLTASPYSPHRLQFLRSASPGSIWASPHFLTHTCFSGQILLPHDPTLCSLPLPTSLTVPILLLLFLPSPLVLLWDLLPACKLGDAWAECQLHFPNKDTIPSPSSLFIHNTSFLLKN